MIANVQPIFVTVRNMLYSWAETYMSLRVFGLNHSTSVIIACIDFELMRKAGSNVAGSSRCLRDQGTRRDGQRVCTSLRGSLCEGVCERACANVLLVMTTKSAVGGAWEGLLRVTIESRLDCAATSICWDGGGLHFFMSEQWAPQLRRYDISSKFKANVDGLRKICA